MVELVDEIVPTLEGADIAVLGYAFKTGTDDTRNTPAKEIVELLCESGANVSVTDPFVSASTIDEEVEIEPSRHPEALAGADALAVVTGHNQYRSLSAKDLIDYVGDEDFGIADGRFVFDPLDFADTPITYCGVGRGDLDG